jgi:hypothetical protein
MKMVTEEEMNAIGSKILKATATGLVLVVAAFAAPMAAAGGGVSWSVNVGTVYPAPRYYSPPPVAYGYPGVAGGVVAINPQPVIINPPMPVYVQPAPQRVIVPPGTVVYYDTPYGPQPAHGYGRHHYRHPHPHGGYPHGARLNYGY